MGIPSHLKHLYPFESRYVVLPAKPHAIDNGEVGDSSSKTADRQLHFLDEGRGPAVLMLHGNPTWSFYYRNVITALRGHFRCVVPDHIGCGLSSKPQTYSYRLVDHIENVCRVIESLGLRSFDLIVHDWGGAIGLGVAQRMPERLGKIVLLNTAAFRAPRLPWQLKLVAENYGYLSPIKSTLEGCVRNLAKSFSRISRVRFNSVNAGPLKTSASAGIPGYLENYLYAEKLTMRKMAVRTAEVADTAVFLLSERSSGINGQGIVVNAGMDLNYFDSEIIRLAMRPDKG